MEANDGDLRVWWIPAMPMDPCYFSVSTPLEAKAVLEALAAYDNFLVNASLLRDYSNMGGFEVFNSDSGEWEEWEWADGRTIEEVCQSELLESY